MSKDWGVAHLAFEAGLHRTYISDLERCARNPSIEIIEKLAKAFDVTAGALVD
ncbi:MAG: helix-turn-helix domain-containing protein [Shimia sp.]